MKYKKSRPRAGRIALVLCSLLLISACGSMPMRQSIADKDKDGVADVDDQCQTTPPNNPVDASGCALFRGAIDGVVFAPGSDRLDGKSREALAEIVTLLQEHPDVALQLGGHTDNLGSARENLLLSKRRVMSVVKYMVANGVAGERLKPFGFGEARPIISNTTAAGRAQNRRIEMSVITQ